MIDLVSCIPIYCFVLCQNQMKLTYYCFLYGSMSMILRVFNQGPEPYVEVCPNITQDLCNGNAHSARKRKLAILINKRHVQILIAGAFPAGT